MAPSNKLVIIQMVYVITALNVDKKCNYYSDSQFFQQILVCEL